jgi:hypothetical protein
MDQMTQRTDAFSRTCLLKSVLQCLRGAANAKAKACVLGNRYFHF